MEAICGFELIRFPLPATSGIMDHRIAEKGNNDRSGTYPSKLCQNQLTYLRFGQAAQLIYNCGAKLIVFKTGLENVHNLELIFLINTVFAEQTSI